MWAKMPMAWTTSTSSSQPKVSRGGRANNQLQAFENSSKAHGSAASSVARGPTSALLSSQPVCRNELPSISSRPAARPCPCPPALPPRTTDELLSRQRQKSQAAREKQLRYRTEPGTDITDDEGGEDDDDDERRGGFSADDDGAAAAAASPAPMLEDEEEEDVGDSDLGGGDGLPDESDYDAEEVGDSGPPSALDITLVGETPGRGKGAAASSSKKKSGSTRKSLAHQRGRSSLAPQPVPMRDEGGEEEGEDGEEGVEEGGADTTRTLSKSKSRLSSAGGLRRFDGSELTQPLASRLPPSLNPPLRLPYPRHIRRVCNAAPWPRPARASPAAARPGRLCASRQSPPPPAHPLLAVQAQVPRWTWT